MIALSKETLAVYLLDDDDSVLKATRRQRVASHLTVTASFFDLWSGQSLDISQEIASPYTQPSMTSPTRRKLSWMSVNLESLSRSAAMMIAAVIGACSHHDPCVRTT